MNAIKPLVFVAWPPALPFADEVLPYFLDIAAHGYDWLHLPAAPSGKAQNRAADEFLKTDNTHIIMLDWDHQHPADIVRRFAWSVAKTPEIQIVGGYNYMRTAPHSPCAWTEDKDGWRIAEPVSPDVYEVERIGFGCVMIAREVFESMMPPWFMYDYSDMTAGGDYQYPGCDMFFCKKVRSHGIKIYCDFGLSSPHMTTKKVTKHDYRRME